MTAAAGDDRVAFLVADLGYGDAGKGTVVDWLTHAHFETRTRLPDAAAGAKDASVRRKGSSSSAAASLGVASVAAGPLVVRTNGGPQAGHNVVLPDGRHHTFAQFGSGLFHDDARTLLAGRMLIEPYAMRNEAAHLRSLGVPDALARTRVDARCGVIAPPQQMANRVRERSRGRLAHGTCGMGVGEHTGDAIARPDLTIVAGDLADVRVVREKLRAITRLKRGALGPLMAFATVDERRVFEDAGWIDIAADVYAETAAGVRVLAPAAVHAELNAARTLIFEGAQGVLLDEQFGFAPHTTWTDTTFAPAETLLRAAGFAGRIERVGVTRTYGTRHGAGPLVTQDAALALHLPEPHNTSAGWQGRFRCGPLDLVALRYALDALGGVDWLAVTHLDRLPSLPATACTAYCREGRESEPLRQGTPAADLASCVPRYTNWPTQDTDAFVAALEAELAVPVRLCSHGPTWRDKHRR